MAAGLAALHYSVMFGPVEAAVTRGQRVEGGQLLATADRASIAEAGYDATTLMVVTNTKNLTAVIPVGEGHVAHGVPALDVEL
ncbi:PTS glucose transporter subunit IIA [Arthrobacter silvisoli]|uniref:PTS glucose transporter subunit IIA n=1 Tax=Arthrobacter silvisoli TaxID=2291022 RepID=UPI000E216A7A|nr:PTS glucose transporter subunit IIA [Arthrobacter silvisoli]